MTERDWDEVIIDAVFLLVSAALMVWMAGGLFYWYDAYAAALAALLLLAIAGVYGSVTRLSTDLRSSPGDGGGSSAA